VKAPFLLTEKLGGDQGLWDRRAVYADEKQRVYTFECSGKALRALEVENRSVDPGFPKRGRFGWL
jgi:hypothetical protein